jgi:hypothetical protein
MTERDGSISLCRRAHPGLRSRARLTAAALACAATILAGCQRSTAGPAAVASAGETQIIRFVPEVPPGDEIPGRCWTGSIAAGGRTDAWRCMAGNMISDPCFEVPARKDIVVCGANPVSGERGFVVKLTEPLPAAEQAAGSDPSPWQFELADGAVCAPFTGTMPSINHEPARYSCARPGVNDPRDSSLLLDLKPGKVWTARRYPESAADQVRKGAAPEGETVEISNLWE